MNSINILSTHVSPPPSSPPSRSNSISAIALLTSEADRAGSAGGGGGTISSSNSTSSDPLLSGRDRPALGSAHNQKTSGDGADSANNDHSSATMAATAASETTPLLASPAEKGGDFGMASCSGSARSFRWRALPKRLAITLWQSLRWVLETLTAPGVYLFAFMYDEQGNFAPLGPLKALFVRPHPSSNRIHSKLPDIYFEDVSPPDYAEEDIEKPRRRLSDESEDSVGSWSGGLRPLSEGTMPASSYSSYAVATESESDFDRRGTADRGARRKSRDSIARRGTAGTLDDDDDTLMGAPGSRRSVRIKLNDDTQKKRKHRRGQSSQAASARGSSSGSVSFGESTKDISAQLKSPTSPAGALTKYPRTPAPPRPLVPRRQPSYLNLDPVDHTHKKTLILDLDETLIHSMSKGGRMSTGHMVEVRLNTTFVGMGGQPSAGPLHPILYYVHKRPYCDEFLRRVYKWYNLVIFTASVQEYADPVIDWLESERKFFSARYYRQHCTFRHGAFIKDLSAVEPDLSKVMILDNSPLSYMFHQDNAIPIQGWISDHTDNDLLHLVPLLEGLQYVSDVRALLALRGGEQGRHMA